MQNEPSPIIKNVARGTQDLPPTIRMRFHPKLLVKTEPRKHVSVLWSGVHTYPLLFQIPERSRPSVLVFIPGGLHEETGPAPVLRDYGPCLALFPLKLSASGLTTGV